MKIAVKVKGSQEWKKHRRCHLGISLQNPNLTGEPLSAIVDWINQQDFDEAFIDLSDTLHRHNLMRTGVNEKQAFRLAIAQGDAWLHDNDPILKGLKIPFRLYRWNHWLNFEDIVPIHEDFKRAFARDDKFRAAIYRDIENFTIRNGKSPTKQDLASGTRYLLEELSVLSFYFQDYSCTKIYPGKEQHCFRLVREGAVKNVSDALSNICYTPLWLHRSQPSWIKMRTANNSEQNDIMHKTA